MGTVVLGVLATLLTSWLLKAPGQVFDTDAVEDGLRSGPDSSVSAEVVRMDDEGLSAITRDEFRPNAAQEQMLERRGSVNTAAFGRLMRAYHAVSPEVVTVRATVTGRRNQKIDIEDIRPLITARTAPLSGSYLNVPPQGAPSTLNMLFDMDRPFPIARNVDVDAFCADGGQQKALGPPFFGQRTITLQDKEQQVLLIRAITTEHYVAFRLEVDYMLGNEKKKAVIDDHGKPFEVSALNLTPDGKLGYHSVYELQSDFSLRRVKRWGAATGIGC
ncbi:hypothetical protein [Streptomyces sp. NPDC046985]|uniref:hypothetical protein n=1 Tax=Streptomyces sp. NPDC046985 TaxID=3155377 RepID=UPI0034046E63